MCYILIQILQSNGQLLTSGARLVAGGLGQVEQSSVMYHYRRLYIFLVSRQLGFIAS
jgi:hypothetical protein